MEYVLVLTTELKLLAPVSAVLLPHFLNRFHHYNIDKVDVN